MSDTPITTWEEYDKAFTQCLDQLPDIMPPEIANKIDVIDDDDHLDYNEKIKAIKEVIATLLN